jgi:hypothetical protein
MNNAIDGGSQSFAMPAVQLSKSVMTPPGNVFHQLFIRH